MLPKRGGCSSWKWLGRMLAVWQEDSGQRQRSVPVCAVTSHRPTRRPLSEGGRCDFSSVTEVLRLKLGTRVESSELSRVREWCLERGLCGWVTARSYRMDVSLQVWVPEREGGGRENWVAEGTGSGMMQEEETELQNVCVRWNRRKICAVVRRCKQPSEVGSSPSSQSWVWRVTSVLAFHKVRSSASRSFSFLLIKVAELPVSFLVIWMESFKTHMSQYIFYTLTEGWDHLNFKTA